MFATFATGLAGTTAGQASMLSTVSPPFVVDFTAGLAPVGYALVAALVGMAALLLTRLDLRGGARSAAVREEREHIRVVAGAARLAA